MKTAVACMIFCCVCFVVQVACIAYKAGFKHGKRAAMEAKP